MESGQQALMFYRRCFGMDHNSNIQRLSHMYAAAAAAAASGADQASNHGSPPTPNSLLLGPGLPPTSDRSHSASALSSLYQGNPAALAAMATGLNPSLLLSAPAHQPPATSEPAAAGMSPEQVRQALQAHYIMRHAALSAAAVVSVNSQPCKTSPEMRKPTPPLLNPSPSLKRPRGLPDEKFADAENEIESLKQRRKQVSPYATCSPPPTSTGTDDAHSTAACPGLGVAAAAVCPLCQERIAPAEMSAHLHQELANFHQLIISMPTTRMPAMSCRPPETSDRLHTYSRVKARRQERLNALASQLKHHASRARPSNTPQQPVTSTVTPSVNQPRPQLTPPTLPRPGYKLALNGTRQQNQDHVAQCTKFSPVTETTNHNPEFSTNNEEDDDVDVESIELSPETTRRPNSEPCVIPSGPRDSRRRSSEDLENHSPKSH